MDTNALLNIKKISEEIVSQAKDLSQWITSVSHETQRKYQREKQQTVRKQELLESTIAQLKEENTRLLEERQALALKSEEDQKEVSRLKDEQQKIELCHTNIKTKVSTLSQAITQTTNEIHRLRRTLEQQESKIDKETKKTLEKIEYYKNKLQMFITPVNDGQVTFLFTINTNQYQFTIELNDSYIIHKCSVEDNKYTEALNTLKETGDVFRFIKEMRDIFIKIDNSTVQKENK
ncbi:hypothetical protein NEOKW01_1540 [Nematocida sp. AWRm80]|nr:hypothetical protein NEOKW01_1540 [Nematocida sp. AWRm80]